MPACQGPQATVPDADVDSAASFLGYLYVVSQYTVRLMTPCVWRILCLYNSSSVPYFRQPPNLPTAARRNRKWTECGTTSFGRNRMSAGSAHLSTFGAETEAEIRSISIRMFCAHTSLLVCWLVRSFVTLAVISGKTPIFAKFSTDVRHLRQISLLTFERSRSKFKVNTAAVLEIFKSCNSSDIFTKFGNSDRCMK